MKCTFTSDDFRGSGQMLIRSCFNSRGEVKPDWSYASTISYKVGYVEGDDGFALVSMCNGGILVFSNDEQFLDHLNSDEYGYRPMTPYEIENVMREVGNRF